MQMYIIIFPYHRNNNYFMISTLLFVCKQIQIQDIYFKMILYLCQPIFETLKS